MSYNPYDFQLQMPDNTRIDHVGSPKEPALNHTELAPADCVRGWVTFEVPQGETPAFVVYTVASPPIKWGV